MKVLVFPLGACIETKKIILFQDVLPAFYCKRLSLCHCIKIIKFPNVGPSHGVTIRLLFK